MSYELKELQGHVDERGCLIEIIKSIEIEEIMEQVYFSTTRPGAVRGNHYHKRKVEWFSVIKGISKFVLEDCVSKEKKHEIILSGDKPMIIKINPNTSHAIQNIGSEDMHLIVIASEVFNPSDADTFYEKII